MTHCAQVSWTQQDSIAVDSTMEKEQGILSAMFKGKPGRALTLSLLLPGAGQFYNRSYWKIPVVYAVLGTNIYVINENKKIYKKFDTAFRMRVDSIPGDEYEGILSTENLQAFRKDSKKTLQQSYFTLGFLYLLTAIESLVDQHLKSFDVNEDLSLDIQPHWSPNLRDGTVSQFGISMVFKLK